MNEQVGCVTNVDYYSLYACTYVAGARDISKIVCVPRRYTNVFDESKINRIRIFAMFWTEYNDSLAFTVMQVYKS